MCWGDEDARRFVSEQPSALLTISGGRLLSCCQRGGSQPRCTCEATGPTPSLPGPPQGVLTAASAEPRALSPTCTRHPQSLTGRHHQGTGRWMPLTPAHSAGTDLSPCVPPSDGKAAEGLRAVWTSLGGGSVQGSRTARVLTCIGQTADQLGATLCERGLRAPGQAQPGGNTAFISRNSPASSLREGRPHQRRPPGCGPRVSPDRPTRLGSPR